VNLSRRSRGFAGPPYETRALFVPEYKEVVHILVEDILRLHPAPQVLGDIGDNNAGAANERGFESKRGLVV